MTENTIVGYKGCWNIGKSSFFRAQQGQGKVLRGSLKPEWDFGEQNSGEGNTEIGMYKTKQCRLLPIMETIWSSVEFYFFVSFLTINDYELFWR